MYFDIFDFQNKIKRNIYFDLALDVKDSNY